MKNINICSVNSWVLAKLAWQIARRHGTDNQVCLSYYEAVDNMVNFYMDISNTLRIEYIEKLKPYTHVGFYTHVVGSNQALNKQTRFMELDGIVTMDKYHEQMLRDEGYAGKLKTVVPGNYQKTFKLSPIKLLVAHRGTKEHHYGHDFLEKFINSYHKIRNLEFVFMGDGWEDLNQRLKDIGVESEHYSDKNDSNATWYPDLYQTGYGWCDFNLVTIEETAGPMCLPESLACGKPTIMPRVGFGINEFPAEHYYEWGNVQSLADILDHELYRREERRSYTKEIYGQSLDWDTFARDVVNFIVEVDEEKNG